MPQTVEWADGAVVLDRVKLNVAPLKGSPFRASRMRAELDALLKTNKVPVTPDANKSITLKLGEISTPQHWQGQKDAAYSLTVSRQGVVITANTVLGLYHGVQTLRQLIVRKDGMASVAACKIHDYPAFKIRGLMHDVGRNFQSIEQLKMQIDVMAAYKMNVFHWHLTDHFGWRLESKKYPGLQSAKAFGRHAGKFYTQKEFKEMSDYCWARGIIIIPEFDSPGHSEAFRHGLGIKNMKDPRALEAMTGLIDELCTLADKERMPYIHVGTDEVRQKDEYVNAGYLPALHKAIHRNGREVIGWWKGMLVKGDKRQILQTWATSSPVKGMRHIDSRANYINHLEALDFAPRMFFQQPCRVPHGDEIHLGGILAHWPDNRVDDERLSLTNNPVLPAMVAYSEAVWKGIARDRPEFWAKVPPRGSAEYQAFADFENRLAEQRNRFFAGKPFPFVKTHQMEWRLLGPVADNEVTDLEKGIIKDIYHANNDVYRWTKPLHGGAIHVKHFFGFPGHLKTFRKGKEVVWANTYIHSDKDQKIDAWISFNTTSSSDNRAGVAKAGNWNANALCKIWINDRRIDPPKWKNPGKMGKEFAFTDEIYTSRPPTKIHLKKGWNKVLVKSAPSWKWVFSFSPVQIRDGQVREVSGLKYSTRLSN
ncbi:MAG: family 20 glycosylhydrolase [Akkermansiaceae bacterium]|nr:family 20 glycosylhydrolase [Akkermansiaceae bacterium]